MFADSALAACVDHSITEQARGETVRVWSRAAPSSASARTADVLRSGISECPTLPGTLFNPLSYTQVVHGSDIGERRTAELAVNDDMLSWWSMHSAGGAHDNAQDARHDVVLYDCLRTFNVLRACRRPTCMLLILIRNTNHAANVNCVCQCPHPFLPIPISNFGAWSLYT